LKGLGPYLAPKIRRGFGFWVFKFPRGAPKGLLNAFWERALGWIWEGPLWGNMVFLGLEN